MSTIEEAIFTRCTTHPGLSALVGTRCYPDVLPEETQFPALRYQRISDPDRATAHDDPGPAGMAGPRFQIDAYASTATEAKAVGEQVRLAWENFRGVVAGVSIYRAIKADRRDRYEEELDMYADSLDFIFWHGETVS